MSSGGLAGNDGSAGQDMTPEELKRVLNEHATNERNRDSVCVFFGCLIILAAGGIFYVSQWSWKKITEKPYKPPTRKYFPPVRK